MQQLIKKLLNNGINADQAEFLIPPNSFISGQNFRVGVTDKGGSGYIENILRNAEKFHVLTSGGINTRIGFAASDEDGWIAKFNYSSTGDHGIFLFDIVSETWYNLLLEADVTGGLGFQKDQLIHSCAIENGCLYWCNSTVSEPRRIDIRASVNLYQPGTFPTIAPYTTPVAQSVINWIRRQPGLPPTIQKMEASVYVNNFIKDSATKYCYRYIYRNYETSTLSALSLLANYNNASQTFNFVFIQIPLGEKIEQDVLQIDLVVKYEDTAKYFIIKSWNINVPDDLSAIEAHNAGSVALNFDFANDFLGIALDSAYSFKPYDSVPLYVQTIAIAKFRSFMSNYTIGYNTPTITSLVAAAQISTSGTLTGQWVKIAYNSGANFHYFIDLGELGFFDVTPQPFPPPYPTPTAYGTMTLVAGGPADFGLYIVAHFTGWVGGVQYPGFPTVITGGPPVPGLSGKVCYKSGGTYQVSIEFLDHAGRKCGILTSQSLKVTIPDRIYDQVEFVTAINWSLSNANALIEIPVWAYYYSINVTKCLTTRNFLVSRVKNITYATKDSSGTYLFNTSSYATTLNGVAIDITLLDSSGMGYVYTPGDLVKVYIAANVYNLAIIGQDGNWVICELKDLGTLGNTGSPKTDALFEIRTPYKPSVSEPNYEVANIFKINNPTTGSRSYSVLAGMIGGDVTLLTRNDGSQDYLTENMSPNDTFYTIWNTDSGRPNFIDDIGQQTKTDSIVWSNTLIEGTKTNGLSTFDALDEKPVPTECGAGMKLQLASKIQGEGNIMLLLCVNEAISLYLSESQLLDNAGTATLAISQDVIGTINVLQGSFGTLNPESVVLLTGRVYWYCLIRESFVSYSNNGITQISDYGIKRVAHLFSNDYASLTPSEIEALGSRPFVFGGVDSYHEEIYWSIPSTTETPPKGYLPDYVSPDLPVIYPYDIYDGRGKVLVFQVKKDRWGAPHSYQTEGFISARDFLYSAKDGAMYKHNVDDGTPNTYNIWYDESVKSEIGLIINEDANVIKEYLTLSVEGNLIQPSWTHVRCELPNIQSSDLVDEWMPREGVFYASIKRDRLSPNASGTFDQKLFTGDRMRGQWAKCYVQFTTNQLLQIRFINCGIIKSGGGNT